MVAENFGAASSSNQTYGKVRSAIQLWAALASCRPWWAKLQLATFALCTHYRVQSYHMKAYKWTRAIILKEDYMYLWLVNLLNCWHWYNNNNDLWYSEDASAQVRLSTCIPTHTRVHNKLKVIQTKTVSALNWESDSLQARYLSQQCHHHRRRRHHPHSP